MKVWLVKIGGHFPPSGDSIKAEYRYFGNDCFVFKDNSRAVRFIREQAAKMNLHEVWTDVGWDEKGKEFVSYLAFNSSEGHEFSVLLNQEEVR